MKKATFKAIFGIFKVSFHIIGILSIIGTYTFLFETFSSNDYSGKIIKTSESLEYKYVCHTFLVNFDKLGERSISVSAGDFLRFDKGDYITWSFSKSDVNPSMTTKEIVLSLLMFCVYISFIFTIYVPKLFNKISGLYNSLED